MKGRGGKRPVNARERQGKKMFLMILPFLILCFLFSYFPLHGWIYAFYDYKAPLKLSQCPFVGFKWFRMFFSNETQMAQLWQVMKNTFAMSFLSIVTSILPLGFAIFLSEIKCKWFKSLVQTMTTLPNFISWVLVYSVAFSLFSNTGMVNTLLQNLGITSEAIKFLDSDSHTWLSMLLWHTWKNLGWSAIMYLAAISGVDQELYEAANVDGAGRLQKIWHVTLPGIRVTIVLVATLNIANILNAGFDQIYNLYSPIVYKSGDIIDTYVYRMSFINTQYSLATAIGLLKSVISFIMIVTAHGLAKKFANYRIF